MKTVYIEAVFSSAEEYAKDLEEYIAWSGPRKEIAQLLPKAKAELEEILKSVRLSK